MLGELCSVISSCETSGECCVERLLLLLVDLGLSFSYLTETCDLPSGLTHVNSISFSYIS